jgi:acetyl esterase
LRRCKYKIFCFKFGSAFKFTLSFEVGGFLRMTTSNDSFALPQLPEPLHPLLRADVAARQARPPLRILGVAEARRSFRETQRSGAEGPDIALIEDHTLATADAVLPIRVYRVSATGTQPSILYFHGGGFVIGDLDTHDRNARGLAAITGATVVSVGYRMTPEHPFPTPVLDSLNAVCAVVARAAELRIDPQLLYVAGDSAGAILALVASLAFRDGAGPRIAGVIAIYPATDFLTIGRTGSYVAFGDGKYGLSTADVEWFRELYVPNAADRRDWRCSPAFAPDINGLPRTLIIGAHYDVLRDEAAAFAGRLADAKAPIAFRIVPGVNHGFMGAPTPPPQVAETLSFIRARFATTR